MSIPAEKVSTAFVPGLVEATIRYDILDRTYYVVEDDVVIEGWHACPVEIQSLGIIWPDKPVANVYDYRVRYFLDPEGDLVVRVPEYIPDAGESLTDAIEGDRETFPEVYTLDDRHVAVVCFIPREWDGQRVTRQVLSVFVLR